MKRSELIFSVILVPLDYVVLLGAAFLAYSLRYLPSVQAVRPIIFDLPLERFMTVAAGMAVGWVLIFALLGLYAIRGNQRLTTELSRVFVGCSAGLALVLAVMVFSRYLFDSRFIILVSWALAVIGISAERILVRWTQRQAYRSGVGVHRVVFIGTGSIVEVLTSYFSTHPKLGFRVVGSWPALTPEVTKELTRLAELDGIDEIIHTDSSASPTDTVALLDIATEYHLTYKYTADLLGSQLVNHEIDTIAGTPIIEIKPTRLDGWGRVLKRVFDLVGSLVFIVVFSPLMLITALAIVIDSRGPVFFSYQRVGQNGKPFRYFKFRSMVADAHQYRSDPEFLAQHKNLRDGTPMMKFADDPRITRVGRFIRRTNIDELPELFLVVWGKMSLVGPRPHQVDEVDRYQNHHKKLLTLKPGMTGLAQVSGRSDLHFEDEVRLDTYYIEHWSLGLDLKILLKTPAAIVRPRTTL
jgi:exopolysaccharide biosynthesis polyprenyl glycosylphosphotransferase